MVGRVSPGALLNDPLADPRRISGNCRFGMCFAADERLLRWPAPAEKEFGEATVTDFYDGCSGGAE